MGFLEGENSFQIEGQPIQYFKAGDTFYAARRMFKCSFNSQLHFRRYFAMKLNVLATLLVLVCCLNFSFVFATTIYVSLNSNFTTIGDALEVASPGDTIEVYL